MVYHNNLYRALIVAIISAAACLSAPFASASYFSEHHLAYGLDAGALETKFQPNYGQGFFEDYVPSTNIFVALQRPDRFGFEIGFSFTPSVGQDTWLGAGGTLPGTSIPLQPGEWELWRSKLSVISGYLGINYIKYLGYNFTAFGLFGGDITRLKTKLTAIENNFGSPDNIAIDYSSTMLIPYLQLGIGYSFYKIVTIRMYYAWRNYALFNPIKSTNFNGTQLKISNSNSVYLGVTLACY